MTRAKNASDSNQFVPLGSGQILPETWTSPYKHFDIFKWSLLGKRIEDPKVMTILKVLQILMQSIIGGLHVGNIKVYCYVNEIHLLITVIR